MNKKKNLKEAGITLVALVVTIIVLLILAGVTISLALNYNGVLDRAAYASNTWANATKNETTMFGEIEQEIEDITGEFTERKIAKIEEKIATNGLVEVAYKPAETNTAITIPGVNNGGIADQEFTQENLGTQNLKWYVLSADENGVNIVSQPTSKEVQFKGAGGYDNCLYYLNEISTNLFANESAGVDSSRVHALNLSDIKKAAEKMNGSTYNWDTQMVQASSTNVYNNGAVGTKTLTLNSSSSIHTKYPQIYGTSTGAVSINNPMYDEEVPANYEPISGDLIKSTSKTASRLTVNYTYFRTYDNATTKTRLGNFGSSGIGGELFNANGNSFWLSTRCVEGVSYSGASANAVNYYLYAVMSGNIMADRIADSYRYDVETSETMRCVVSIPGSRVNVSNDGTVTLK